MKRSLLAVALAATTAIAAAQTSVTLTKVLDVATARSGTGSVYAATYVPGDDKFIASKAGTVVEIYNAATGAYETNMSLSGITTGGNGFFALTASENGVIYGYEAGGGDLWRWAGTTDAAADKVYDTASFARVGYTGTDGSSVTIAMTGAATDGDVEFFSDSFPFASGTFTFNESMDLDAKSALAINNDGTVAFTSGDTANPVEKWVKAAGAWGATPVWSSDPIAINAGPMAYDNLHDILFVAPARPANAKKLYVLSGADGSILGEATLDNAIANLPGYCGGYAVPTANGGTVYLVGRGATASDTVMYVYDYVVPNTGVADWSLYQQ